MDKSTKDNRSFKTFVPALPQKRDLAPINTSYPIVDISPTIAPTERNHDAMTHAKATLLVSSAYIVAAFLITLGLLLLAWLFKALGDAWGLYVYGGLIAWGVAVLVALWGNRKQSLWHSPTGLGHHEIDSRERIAMHALDTHADLLLERWKIEHGDD